MGSSFFAPSFFVSIAAASPPSTVTPRVRMCSSTPGTSLGVSFRAADFASVFCFSSGSVASTIALSESSSIVPYADIGLSPEPSIGSPAPPTCFAPPKVEPGVTRFALPFAASAALPTVPKNATTSANAIVPTTRIDVPLPRDDSRPPTRTTSVPPWTGSFTTSKGASSAPGTCAREVAIPNSASRRDCDCGEMTVGLACLLTQGTRCDGSTIERRVLLARATASSALASPQE